MIKMVATFSIGQLLSGMYFILEKRLSSKFYTFTELQVYKNIVCNIVSAFLGIAFMNIFSLNLITFELLF
jgi:hypothetical protein